MEVMMGPLVVKMWGEVVIKKWWGGGRGREKKEDDENVSPEGLAILRQNGSLPCGT